jgi:hypothetical protein
MLTDTGKISAVDTAARIHRCRGAPTGELTRRRRYDPQPSIAQILAFVIHL